MAHIYCRDDIVASVIPASGAVGEYSMPVGGFEGLDFEESISGTVIDYALRYGPFCLASWIHYHQYCSHCQYMLDVSGRSDWHQDIGLFTTVETTYVTSQLVALVEHEGQLDRYSSVLSGCFIERARFVSERNIWILPLHYE